MNTLELEFSIKNKPALAVIEFSDDAQQPIAAIRLSFGDFRAVGMANVRECLGEGLDSLIAHAMSLREGN